MGFLGTLIRGRLIHTASFSRVAIDNIGVRLRPAPGVTLVEYAYGVFITPAVMYARLMFGMKGSPHSQYQLREVATSQVIPALELHSSSLLSIHGVGTASQATTTTHVELELRLGRRAEPLFGGTTVTVRDEADWIRYFVGFADLYLNVHDPEQTERIARVLGAIEAYYTRSSTRDSILSYGRAIEEGFRHLD